MSASDEKVRRWYLGGDGIVRNVDTLAIAYRGLYYVLSDDYDACEAARVEAVETQELTQIINTEAIKQRDEALAEASALRATVERLRDVIGWALGEGDEFAQRLGRGPYYWRVELRERYQAALAPVGATNDGSGGESDSRSAVDQLDANRPESPASYRRDATPTATDPAPTWDERMQLPVILCDDHEWAGAPNEECPHCLWEAHDRARRRNQ